MRTPGEGVGNAAGTYFSVDEDHLVDRLRYAEANWEAEYEKTKNISIKFREIHQWAAVLREFVELVPTILEEEDVSRSKEIISARYGRLSSAQDR